MGSVPTVPESAGIVPRQNQPTHIPTARSHPARTAEGVEQAFAVQAGREVRIMVKPDVISDYQVILLARQIAKKIEDTLDYPGQIKVNVIRESRAIEYAK